MSEPVGAIKGKPKHEMHSYQSEAIHPTVSSPFLYQCLVLIIIINDVVIIILTITIIVVVLCVKNVFCTLSLKSPAGQ